MTKRTDTHISSGLTPDTMPGSATAPGQSVSFDLANVAPPSDVYITRDDQLLISCMSSVAGEVVRVRYRILAPDGSIGVNEQDITLPAAYAPSAATPFFTAREGYLLTMGVTCASANKRGQTFVRVGLARAATTFAGAIQVLLADYVNSNAPIGWPGTGVFDPTDRNGAIRRIQPGNPAAGADWSVQAPLNARWQVRGVTALLTTAAAVANRNPRLQIANDFTLVSGQLIPAFSDQAASLAITYSIGGSAFAPTAAGAATLWSPSTPVVIDAQGRISTITANIQAADQWSNIVVDVEEWLSGL